MASDNYIYQPTTISTSFQLKRGRRQPLKNAHPRRARFCSASRNPTLDFKEVATNNKKLGLSFKIKKGGVDHREMRIHLFRVSLPMRYSDMKLLATIYTDAGQMKVGHEISKLPIMFKPPPQLPQTATTKGIIMKDSIMMQLAQLLEMQELVEVF